MTFMQTGVLSVLITFGCSQSFKRYKAFPKKRFAARAFRMEER